VLDRVAIVGCCFILAATILVIVIFRQVCRG
jgi:hypothetical protein